MHNLFSSTSESSSAAIQVIAIASLGGLVTRLILLAAFAFNGLSLYWNKSPESRVKGCIISRTCRIVSVVPVDLVDTICCSPLSSKVQYQGRAPRRFIAASAAVMASRKTREVSTRGGVAFSC